jgi:two-component system sensor histidine kinase TctE
LTVTVSDDGKGIVPANHQQALARFSQIAPTSGSGLGLPIAQAITEGFNGHIELASNADTFAVALHFRRNH